MSNTPLDVMGAAKRGVTVSQKEMATYMANPISPQETEITNTLANTLLAMGQQADALHVKIAKLEGMVAKMQTVLHAAVLAANNQLPEVPKLSLDGTSPEEPETSTDQLSHSPDILTSQSSSPTAIGSLQAGSSGSNGNPSSPFALAEGRRSSQPSSTNDFMALMNSIKPEAVASPPPGETNARSYQDDIDTRL